jgi:hypothetical protein
MKDEFLMEVTRLVGDALVAPLIEIIVKFARPIYIFASLSTWHFHFYDHMTRQIVDSQNMPGGFTQNIGRIVKATSTTTSKQSLFFVDRDEYKQISICPLLKYNMNKFTPQNLLIIQDAIITDTVSSTKDSFIATGDSLFARTSLSRSWRRFDFTTQKWDSDEIPDNTTKVQKDTLNVASIGPRSFVGLENLAISVDDGQHRYRCFVYDGDSSESKKHNQKQKSVIIPLPDLVGEHSYYGRILAFGIVRHDQSRREMILAMFRLDLVYVITIKTRNPLTCDPPMKINLATLSTVNWNQTSSYPTTSFFILEDQLWAFLAPKTSEQRSISYRFSFETMDWILSGTVPRELYISSKNLIHTMVIV